MATYPQGATSFIPDYQPFEPDLNFAANVLQLKQTQYDQNWSKINNVYGQIVNAPLSHPESIRRRANTVNAIEFDLQRVSGLDLSLDQNVHQATQIFRPFYEDQNLMKDIVFTKNAGFERALGEGKRISVDQKVRSEYWEGGLRYIDEKIKDFQALPYDKLTSFGDAQYVPYVNVEKKAEELANEMDYTIDMATPNGQWIIREKNGKPLIPKLQSIFYSILGEDPMIRKVYDVQAYLHRKSSIAELAGTKYNGDQASAEREYLGDMLNTLRTQTQKTTSTLSAEKKANDNKILRLRHQIERGDKTAATAQELDRYKKANADIEKLLKRNKEDVNLINNDINRTLTTEGGSELSFDDLENMRMRIDAVVSSNMLQADLDKAAQDFAYKDYKLDYEANPFAMQHQKYLYDLDLMERRKEAQKDVEDHKAKIAAKKALDDERMATGYYYRDPVTLEVKLKPELANWRAMPKNKGKTGPQDPTEMLETVDEMFNKLGITTAQQIEKVLSEMLANEIITADEVIQILEAKPGASNQGLGYDYSNFIAGLRAQGAIKTKEDRMLYGQGLYVTELEKEMAVPEVRAQELLKGMRNYAFPTDKRGNLKYTPEFLGNVKKNMDNVLEKLSSDESIRGDAEIKQLNELSYQFDNYLNYKKKMVEYKAENKAEVINKLKAKGFNYAEALFDENNDFVQSKKQFFINASRLYSDEIELDNGMSWAEYGNTILATGSAGAGVGSAFGGIGAIPGFIGGAAAAAVAYPISNLFEWGYNALSEDGDLSGARFTNGTTGAFGGKYSIGDEFDEMLLEYDNLVQDSELSVPVPGIAKKGTGLAFTPSGITIAPGVRSPFYDEFLKLQKIINSNTDAIYQPDERNYVSLGNIDEPFDAVDLEERTRAGQVFGVIYKALVEEAANSKSDIGNFMVGVTPAAGGDMTLAGVVIDVPKKLLDKFYNATDESKGFLTKTEYDALASQGLTYITDASKLNQTTMYRTNFESMDQMRIKQAGEKGVTYTDPTLPGFSVNYKVHTSDPSGTQMLVTKYYPIYQGPGMPYAYEKSANIVNLGSNIALDRQHYFRQDAIDRIKENTRLENYYGPAATE